MNKIKRCVWGAVLTTFAIALAWQMQPGSALAQGVQYVIQGGPATFSSSYATNGRFGSLIVDGLATSDGGFVVSGSALPSNTLAYTALDSSGNVQISAPAGKTVGLANAGSTQWRVDGSALYPVSDNTKDLCSSTNRCQDGYIINLKDGADTFRLLLGNAVGNDYRSAVVNGAAACAHKHRTQNTLTAGTDRYLDCFYNDDGTTLKMAVASDGTPLRVIGTDTTLYPVGATLSVSSTAVGNLGAGEDDLQSFTLPANSLITTNRGIRVHACGSAANNANAKTLKFYFGSQVFTTALPTSIAIAWCMDVDVIRTGASAQRTVAEARIVNTGTNALTDALQLNTIAATETSTIVIKATGTATTDNDIIQNTMVVEAF